MVNRSKAAGRFTHFGEGSPTKARQTLVPNKIPHTHTHTWVVLTAQQLWIETPAHTQPLQQQQQQLQNCSCQGPAEEGRSQHPSTQSCMTFIRTSHLTDNCKALVDPD